MSQSLFLYLKPRQRSYESFPWYIRKKKQWSYLFRHLPWEGEKIEVLGREGILVELPFTLEQLEEADEKALSDILYRLQVETQISYIAVEKSLQSFFPFEWVCDGKILPLFLAEKILDRVGELEKIPKKKMHIVILAGDDIYAGFLLKELGKVYNYMTLVAEDSKAYEEQFHCLYEEYGLAVSFLDTKTVKLQKSLPEGSVFIDLTGENNGFCRLFPRNARILDVLGEKDVKFYLGKREDITIYNDFSFGKEKEIPSGLIQAALGQESSWLMKGSLTDYNQLVKNLDLKVFAVKMRFS